MSCGPAAKDPVSIYWDDSLPVAIDIHASVISTSDVDSLEQALTVRRKGSTSGTGVLGQVSIHDGHVRFSPVVPFTRGETYEVVWQSGLIGEIIIPPDETATIPKVVAVFPSQDTIPENTLKMYVQFSEPMAEGRALQHVVVKGESGDTLRGTFLDLQPELWNDDRTVLTLWIDPGRVKRDLIPNRELGIPLPKGSVYQLIIRDTWVSAKGKPLEKSFSKSFYVTNRDERRPSMTFWKLQAPAAGTTNHLVIIFPEPLDRWQLERDIRIIDGDGEAVPGEVMTTDEETRVTFKPTEPWRKGRYQITVPGTLEDLAGNNLNRLFDADITTEITGTSSAIHRQPFVVQ